MLIDDARKAKRIRTKDFDDELNILINACKKDLTRRGVLEQKIIDDDPLIKTAVICYVKAYFGDNSNVDIWVGLYDDMANALALDSQYNE